MNLGLALSGGGFRATVYHLGVLARLAHEDKLEDVTFLSTVSGGSLCVGLAYALNQFNWPSSQAYRETVLPQARRQMTTQDFQAELLRWALRAPWRFFRTKASGVSRVIQQEWGVSIRLNELPSRPRWMINATCYETGKNWRFERFRMGDYLFGYTNDTDIPLSHALAASAGFPGLIGPLVLSTKRQRWFKYKGRSQDADTEAGEAEDSHLTETIKPAFSRVHLWDGGVYDNHGLEGVHDFTTGWRQGIDFLVISDGSGKAKVETYRLGAGVFLRIITGVMMDQIRSLRSRAVLERIRNHDDKGVYLTIGRDCRSVIAAAGKSQELAPLYRDSLTSEKADRAGDFPTVIRKLTDAEFELLYRHGFEIADCTLHTYYPDLFGHVVYQTAG